MTIIRSGMNNKNAYKAECPHCNCVFECSTEEVIGWTSPRGDDAHLVNLRAYCPECNKPAKIEFIRYNQFSLKNLDEDERP